MAAVAQAPACLTWVPTKPCDETRPQERGFNKRYRFLELRLRDFPEEDLLCLAGGQAEHPRDHAVPFLLCCPNLISVPGNAPPSHSVL